MNDTSATACRACGAPLDVRNLVSESGWREAPRIRDMTEIHFGASTCQVEGEVVPVAEINLGQGDSIFFEHHVMLWKDERVPLSLLPLSGGIARAFSGMPFLISVATGPGRIAFSRDATGELVLLPLHPGMELDAREHAFLLSSHHISYSFVRVKGLTNILFGGQGMYMDRFVTGNTPGLADSARATEMCSSGGSRKARASWWNRVRSSAGDSTVSMDVEFQRLGSGLFGGATAESGSADWARARRNSIDVRAS